MIGRGPVSTQLKILRDIPTASNTKQSGVHELADLIVVTGPDVTSVGIDLGSLREQRRWRQCKHSQ
jgi:hypothetical protein